MTELARVLCCPPVEIWEWERFKIIKIMYKSRLVVKSGSGGDKNGQNQMGERRIEVYCGTLRH